MSPRRRVRITRQAEREIRDAATWWLEHRTAARGSFAEEIERTCELIAAYPGIGARCSNPRLHGARRVYLARIRYHLLYRVEEPDVVILGLWHARRDSRPSL